MALQISLGFQFLANKDNASSGLLGQQHNVIINTAIRAGSKQASKDPKMSHAVPLLFSPITHDTENKTSLIDLKKNNVVLLS